MKSIDKKNKINNFKLNLNLISLKSEMINKLKTKKSIYAYGNFKNVKLGKRIIEKGNK